jgi:hypothetical protein
VLELVPFPAPDVSTTSPAESATLPNTSLSLRCTATAATSGTPLVLRSKLSGPGSVSFDDPSTLDTRANFSVPGLYQLRCAATFSGITGTSVRNVNVATPTEHTLRQGVSGYAQETTTIRADNPTWNAGPRIHSDDDTFTLEWSDILGDDWSSVNVTTHPPLGISASSESVHCTLPVGPAGKRLVRLKISTS